jgi:hypothetical protein
VSAAIVTSGFVWPTRSTMRPTTGAEKPTLKPAPR